MEGVHRERRRPRGWCREGRLEPPVAEVSVGRGTDNDLSLAWDAQVSRYHAELTRRGDTWFLSDDGSRNGSTVNGERASTT